MQREREGSRGMQREGSSGVLERKGKVLGGVEREGSRGLERKGKGRV